MRDLVISLYQKDLAITERLSKSNESLQRKQQVRSEYDQTIQETETAYMYQSHLISANFHQMGN